jgi:hypothetical protein
MTREQAKAFAETFGKRLAVDNETVRDNGRPVMTNLIGLARAETDETRTPLLAILPHNIRMYWRAVREFG